MADRVDLREKLRAAIIAEDMILPQDEERAFNAIDAVLALPAEPPQLVEAIVREIEGEPFSTREELWDLVSKAVERIEMWTAEEVKEEFNGHVNYKGVIEISCASLADELNRIAVSLTPASRSQAKRIAAQSGAPAPSESTYPCADCRDGHHYSGAAVHTHCGCWCTRIGEKFRRK